MVTMLGPSFLVETIEDVLKAIEVLVAGKVGTHGLVDAQSKAQETYRMQHEVIEGVDAANAHPIATSAMELLASIVRVMGANPSFLPAYQRIWSGCQSSLPRWNAPGDLTSCYILAEALFETYERDAVFVVSGILPMLPVTASYRNEFTRANTFYLISLLFDVFPQEMEGHLTEFCDVLRTGLEGYAGDVRVREECKV